jgi:hypothetical protein
MPERDEQRDVRGDVRAQIREFLSTRRARIRLESAELLPRLHARGEAELRRATAGRLQQEEHGLLPLRTGAVPFDVQP